MDLSLDLNPASATFGDLLRIDGDLVATSDVDPRGTHFVLQDIVQRLRVLKGEWFLDKALGVPYLQLVLIKNPNLPQIEQAFKDAILSTPGVLRLMQFSMTFDRPKRLLTVTFQCVTTQGTINYALPTTLQSTQVAA